MEKLVKSDQELDELRRIYFTNSLRKGYKTFQGCTMPEKFERMMKDIDEFEIFDDDIWVISFPKCGTTWTQEMVWCICNNLDYEHARRENLADRFPFLELTAVLDFEEQQDIPQIFDSVNFTKAAKRPRFLKTHLPWDLLPKQIRNFEKKPKIIIPMRNPKDVCVSFYHHSKFLDRYEGDFELFWQLFITGKLPWCPFMSHILSYWNRRDQMNVLFVKYEEMQKDLKGVIGEVAKFCGVSLRDEQLGPLLKHLSFEEMSKNPAINLDDTSKIMVDNKHSTNPDGKFLRKGKAGSYKEEMAPEVQQLFDEWIEESLKNTGLEL